MVQAGMEDKVRIKNLKSLFAFFEKFGRVSVDSFKAPSEDGSNEPIFNLSQFIENDDVKSLDKRQFYI